MLIGFHQNLEKGKVADFVAITSKVLSVQMRPSENQRKNAKQGSLNISDRVDTGLGWSEMPVETVSRPPQVSQGVSGCSNAACKIHCNDQRGQKYSAVF